MRDPRVSVSEQAIGNSVSSPRGDIDSRSNEVSGETPVGDDGQTQGD